MASRAQAIVGLCRQPPVLIGLLLRPADGQTGIVDQDVKPAQAVVHRRKDTGHALAGRDIGGQSMDVGVRIDLTRMRQRVLQFRLVPPKGDDARPLFDQQRHRDPPDAGRAAGHQNPVAGIKRKCGSPHLPATLLIAYVTPSAAHIPLTANIRWSRSPDAV